MTMDAIHWRTRAEEARALANEIPDVLSQRLVRGMAGDYEQLADLADEWGKASGRRRENARHDEQPDRRPYSVPVGQAAWRETERRRVNDRTAHALKRARHQLERHEGRPGKRRR